MSPKAIPCALFTVVAMLGAPESIAPRVPQPRPPSVVAQLAAPPVALPDVAPATKPTPSAPTTKPAAPAPTTKPAATVRSKVASVASGVTSSASKLPTVTTPPKIVRGPTSWTLLNQAIARIPNYRSGVATWVVTNQYGHWGVSVVKSFGPTVFTNFGPGV
ncbi:MAG: hypothetical protein HHJ11_03140 [Phycicoccus sp.]|nr:hypothetical protein [Phycicoccus sp.]